MATRRLFKMANLSENIGISTEVRGKLKHLLGLSKCNHKVEIMKEPDIKCAHIYCVLNQLSG